MKVATITSALTLPPESRVDQRVPKKLLVERGAPTSSDKRQINEGIEELLWLAVLKPTTIGVPDYRDAVREYLEIAVLSLTLRPAVKAGRLVELIHRAIPYPVLLMTAQSDTLSLSLAHKRLAQNEADKVVLDEAVTACVIGDNPFTDPFLASLSLEAQPQAHLFALYQGWKECVEALLAAQLTGRFARPSSAESATDRRKALLEHDRLTREIAALRAQAARESQLNRRVELNLEIKRLEAALAQAHADL
jgi:hypothetical protein